ncbi:MAG: GntR family transcriptional regulator [Christensenellaceae bacterium]
MRFFERIVRPLITIKLDKTLKMPIYEQLIAGIKNLIMTGKLHAHQQIISVRAMAKELGINPNTVQKAYALLKQDDLLYSVAGKGDFITESAVHLKDFKKDEIKELFYTATKQAQNAGMWIDEIFTIIDEAYSSN